ARDADLLRRLPRRERDAVPLSPAARGRRRHGRGNDVRRVQDQRQDRSEEIRGQEMTRRLIALLLLLPFSVTAPAFAQSNREVGWIGPVVHQPRAVIPAAEVKVIGLEAATQARPVAPVKTSEIGVATLTGLAPGRYAIQAEFAGFEIGELKDVRLRPGDNKHVVVLPVKGFEQTVTVERDKQEAAGDRRSATFGT